LHNYINNELSRRVQGLPFSFETASTSLT
jgi:hypothetical protein